VRVLVVEDSVKMAALLRRGFEEAGYAVDVARDGEEATWAASETPYDVVVLDIVLGTSPSAIDGFEVCRRIRAAGSPTPALMLTARDAVEDRVRGLDVGADDYLVKPFSLQELLARIRALARRGSGERSPVLSMGSLALDPATREVRRDDHRIDLTAKEFALLEHFMRHPNEVLSRTNLLDHVWDFAFEGDSNVVEVHVRHLREKIDRPFGRASLETVRGVGYRLRDEVPM
jgi:two-component system OmpR family response regulator